MLAGRRRLSAVVFLLLAFILSGCTELGPDPASQATPTPIPPPPAPERPTYRVQRGQVIDQVVFTARVSPAVEESLFFQVNGRVKATYVQRDDVVEPGDILAELENDDLVRQMAQTQLDLDNARNNLQQSINANTYNIQRAEVNLRTRELQLAKLQNSTAAADVEIARANLQRAEATVRSAQAAYDRRASQPGVEASSEALNLERATIELDIAQANLNKALAAQRNLQYDIDIQRQQVILAQMELENISKEVDQALVNSVERAQLAVDRLQAQLDQTRVIATIPGKVTTAAASPGTNVTAYRPVFIVSDDSQLNISQELRDEQMSRLAEGMEVGIRFNQAPDRVYKGTIEQLPYPYGAGGGGVAVQERDRMTRISFEASDLSLRPGAIAEITAVLEVKDDVLWLPPIAIRSFGGRTFVVVDEDGRAQSVDVRIGIKASEQHEILDGITENAVVIGP